MSENNKPVFSHNAKLRDGRIYHGSYIHNGVVTDIITVDGDTVHRSNCPDLFTDLFHRFDSESGVPMEAVNSAVSFLRHEQWQRREKFRMTVHKAEDFFSAEELTKIKVWSQGNSIKTLEAAMRLREFGIDSSQTLYFVRNLSCNQLFDFCRLVKNYGEGKTSGKIRHIVDKARNFTYLRHCLPEMKRWSGNLPEVLDTLEVFANILAAREDELATNNLGDYCPQLKKLSKVA